MSEAVSKTQITEAPNAYCEAKDRVNALKGVITQEGLRNQIVTFLGERAGLPISKTFKLKLLDRQFYSEDFPGIPLEDLYSRSANDSIFDRRAPADKAYIQTLQEWATNIPDEEFHWIQISPTSQIMENGAIRQLSNETVFEIGRMFNANGSRQAEIKRMSSPFIPGETVQGVFERLKVVGDLLCPREFTHAQSELDFIANPILLKENTDFEQIMRKLDSFLEESSTCTRFINGQPVEENTSEILSTIYDRFDYAIATVGKELNKYISACFDRNTNLSDLHLYVRSLVNQFDVLFAGGAVDNIGDTSYWGEQPVEFVAKGCGGFGGELSLANLTRIPDIGFSAEDKYGKLEFECQHCGKTNRRPTGQLIENCQKCGKPVRCK